MGQERRVEQKRKMRKKIMDKDNSVLITELLTSATPVHSIKRKEKLKWSHFPQNIIKCRSLSLRYIPSGIMKILL